MTQKVIHGGGSMDDRPFFGVVQVYSDVRIFLMRRDCDMENVPTVIHPTRYGRTGDRLTSRELTVDEQSHPTRFTRTPFSEEEPMP